MRMKFNHKKIVNLGKMQKFSRFATSLGGESGSVSWWNQMVQSLLQIIRFRLFREKNDHLFFILSWPQKSYQF